MQSYNIPGTKDPDDIIVRAAKIFLISSFANPDGAESFTIVDALSLFGLNAKDARNQLQFDRCSQYVSKYICYYMNLQTEVTNESTFDEKKAVLRRILVLIYPYELKNLRLLGNMAGLTIGVGSQSKCKDYHICYSMYKKVYNELKEQELVLKSRTIINEVGTVIE